MALIPPYGCALNIMNSSLKQYLVITGNYWAFTLTDGALRMLVVLHFHGLGYSPLAIASLFLFYEFFGIVTNLFGGWLGARAGLNRTMQIGLGLQIVALAMLLLPDDYLTLVWVMAAQALSGIAKDLNKMSAKSAIKLLIPANESGRLYRWVAALTGSKNALKGVGFFLGGVLLWTLDFQGAACALASLLILVWLLSFWLLQEDIGRKNFKPKFTELFSKSRAINQLSAARFFLFGARDVWFVIALPVFLASQFRWSHLEVGGLLALWVIGYGAVQAMAPRITGNDASITFWGWPLVCITATLAGLMLWLPSAWVLVAGLWVFGALFAINSSLHSFAIVKLAHADGVSLDVGFYYMANAGGRLAGTLLSGWVFQQWGLVACLWVSAGMLLLATVLAPRDL